MSYEYKPWSMDDDPAGSFSCKMVIVGDSGVGKTAIAVRFSMRVYETRRSTIGVEFFSSRFIVDGKRVCLQAWDTAGQERFGAVSKAYMNGAKTALLVVALDKAASLDKLKEIREMVRERAPTCICMLVANKSDKVVDDKTHLGGVDLRELAKQLDCAGGYMAVSAQNDTNIDAAIIGITALALRQRNKERLTAEEKPVEIVPETRISIKTCC
jgi:small GTP-binding protein